MRCILHYEVKIPQGLGRSFWKLQRARGTVIEDPSFCFHSCSCRVLLETSKWTKSYREWNSKVWTSNFKLNTSLRTLFASCRYTQWKSVNDVFVNRMRQIWEEAPKKLKWMCATSIFFIPKSVPHDLLQEGFNIKEISLILAVSESGLLEDKAIRIEQVRVHWQFRLTLTWKLKKFL